jgi:hypothetical protein
VCADALHGLATLTDLGRAGPFKSQSSGRGGRSAPSIGLCADRVGGRVWQVLDIAGVSH